VSNKRVLSIVPSPFDGRDWDFESIYPVELKEDYVDYREEHKPIRDQGSQGACAAFGACAMKEWQEFKDIGFKDYFSPQFIYNLRNNKDSSGMTTRDLMKILSKIGVVPEAMYPYLTKEEISEKLFEEAGNHLIGSYARVTTKTGLLKAMKKKGPCLIAVPVYNYSERMWKKGPGDKFLGGHLMEIVATKAKGAWIRNSWGEGSGQEGYHFFPWEDFGCQWEIWSTVDMKSVEPDFNSKISYWFYKVRLWFSKYGRVAIPVFIFLAIFISFIIIGISQVRG